MTLSQIRDEADREMLPGLRDEFTSAYQRVAHAVWKQMNGEPVHWTDFDDPATRLEVVARFVPPLWPVAVFLWWKRRRRCVRDARRMNEERTASEGAPYYEPRIRIGFDR